MRKKRYPNFLFKVAFVAAMLGLLIGGAFYIRGFKDIAVAQVEKDLPLVGTVENLRNLLEQYGQYDNYMYRGMAVTESFALQNSKEMATAPQASSADDYSATNIQVEGVDEGDAIKTDGNFIYQINNNQIQIIQAVPADKMQVVNIVKFNDQNFSPLEIYIAGDYMVVAGDTYTAQYVYPIEEYNDQAAMRIAPSYYYQKYYQKSLCRAIVYDIKDKQNIMPIRRLVLEGNYLTSRLTDDKFYLLSNCSLDYYALQNDTELTPICKDTVQADRFDAQDLKNIRYFPGYISPNYLVTGVIDLQQIDEAAAINTYLGGGENVYASQQNLYVAISQYEHNYDLMRPMQTAADSSVVNTKIFKFGLRDAQLQYEGEGQVPGLILNQFSMDEYNEHFRIATTYGDIWRDDEDTTQNNVYILDKDLQITGKIENIAPGECIYSTRFMGDRAYMVTFKDVDPFFVLDLSEPTQPQILGKLKIPGYSDYLHPYDENHIIGFGKDTIEVSASGGASQAYYQGLKIAIFDVTDVSQPVEMSKVVIGDRGSDSELLRNHKALLFSPEKNLLALPVTVMTVDESSAQQNAKIVQYGNFSFQGAYIYNIDLQQGLQFKGRITHLDDEDYLKAGNYWHNTDKSINRILYIGDALYTLSPAMIKSSQLQSLQEIQTLPLQ